MPRITDHLKIDLERLIEKHANEVKAAADLGRNTRANAIKFANNRAFDELIETLETHHNQQRREDTEPFPGKLLPDCG